ncbi:MAG TPA: hypothetical protein VNM48_15725, partial [Chloroflexota bacterium]|nr:hypothetical protein [Chloroflexota bacterium]
MAAPITTFNAAGNAYAATALAAAGVVSVDVDFSTAFVGQATVKVTMGAAVATARGLQIDVLPGYGTGGTTYSTVPLGSPVIGSSTGVSGVASRMIPVDTGKYRLTLTNLDATNAV